MKSYIAPAVRAINIEAEDLIATSPMTIKETQKSEGWSNQRDASSSIWGDED